MASSAGKPKVPSGYILVADTWKNTQLADNLCKSSSVKFTDGLGIVDFCPSEDVSVIFISEADLLCGNAYRRRVVKFRHAVETSRGVVIVQKTLMTSELFGSLQKFVSLEVGLTLIPVSSVEEVGQLLMQMVTCEAKINVNPFRMKSKSTTTPDAAILACTTMIPGLGEKKALLLLKHFGSLKALSNASQENIAEVLGPSAATSVNQFLRTLH